MSIITSDKDEKRFEELKTKTQSIISKEGQIKGLGINNSVKASSYSTSGVAEKK